MSWQHSPWCWCHLCSSPQPAPWTRNIKWCSAEINIFTDHTHQRTISLDKQLRAVSTQPRGIGNVRKEGLELWVHWWNGKESMEFRIYRWNGNQPFSEPLHNFTLYLLFTEFDNTLIIGGMGKRAWNSGFTGGMGKRAWNSGFNGGMGKRAWNSGFTGIETVCVCV